ncbi:MAG: ribose-phosphate pyrophosphokinase [Deltaproteobacteria bacterium]|nr:ribose-phosphate pyrophosphokinase [Deltaproteobacteria bacterium]
MLAGTYKVFAGNSNPSLAKEVCAYLDRPLSRAEVQRFSDGEISIEITDNVRGTDVFIVQSTSAQANDHLMELLIMMDACRRASAGSITAVIPYYGYARQDRKVRPRTPITASLVAQLLETAGADRVVSLDMHAGQIQGFFKVPFDHLFAMPVLLDHMRKRFEDPANVVIVSPDAGGVERARAYSKRLGCSIAIVDKRRVKANVAEVLHVIGEVEGKTAVLLDDMIDTAGTLTHAAKALKEHGAQRVFSYASHGVLSGPAISRIQESEIEEVIITDTIPLTAEARACDKIQVLSVAWLLGEAIRRIHAADSLSSLFV